MDEVRSYWQVAGIAHFCNLFGRTFKLPQFEPEELEQAFTLDVPEPEQQKQQGQHHDAASEEDDESNQCQQPSHDRPESDNEQNYDQESSPSTSIPATTISTTRQQTNLQNERAAQHQQQQQQQQQQAEEQQPQDMHLLIKLGIALLKPHFNTKISQANWENYLRRIVDNNWVELEHHPSPFQVPIISKDGVELTKNLTFNELPLSDKIDLFYALCDYRFWTEDASDLIKDYTLEELRLENIGKDSQGYEYWYFFGTRLFREDKELTNDIIMRKKRIKELEYDLIELEKNRIIREKEERRKAELEKARQMANEAREARLALKRQQEQETQRSKRRKSQLISDLPPRTGLRERRSSAAGNANSHKQNETPPTTRSRVTRLQQQEASPSTSQAANAHQSTRGATRNSKGGHNKSSAEVTSDLPKKSTEEEYREELERLKITPEHRANAWRLECDSLEEWENFATKFEKTKSVNEKYLSAYINEELLPKIRAIYAKRAAEARRKEKELLYSLASRRVSSRIITRRAQEEEEERLAQEREAEIRRKKVEAEHRLRVELEREMRSRRNKPLTNGGVSSTCSDDGAEEANTGPYNLRNQQAQQVNNNLNEFDGIIHPDALSEFYEALELIVDSVRTSKHAWPFVDPVPETVPGYYDLIEEPMDLKKLRTKVEFREYKSLIELEKDFQLLVNNCEKFNGPKNVYTKMVYKLWKSFRKNVRLYLQRDLTMNEYETFLYPPPLPVVAENCADNNTNEPTSEQAGENRLEDIKSETLAEAEPITEEPGLSDTAKPNDTNYSIVQDLKHTVQEQRDFNGESIAEPRNTNGTQNNHNFPPHPLKSEPPAIDVHPLPETVFDPPEPITEEIIIDSYDVPCPDDNVIIVWPEGQHE